MDNNKDVISSNKFESMPDVSIGIKDMSGHRVLEFVSGDDKTCEAYITAIADVLSDSWPDDGQNRQQHIRNILLRDGTRKDKVRVGYHSFPLSFHDAFSLGDDNVLLAKIKEKAELIYSQIKT